MPQNTPNRGYPYPLYNEPTMDFPASIQALAVDIDADVGALDTYITDAYDQPSARIVGAGTLSPVAHNTVAIVPWTFGTVAYDNDAMATMTATGGLTLTDPGVYQVSAYINLVAPGSGSTFYIRVAFTSSAGFIGTPASMSLRGHPTQDTWLSLSALHYVVAGPDLIQTTIWHDQGTTLQMAAGGRQMTATRIGT